MTTTLPALATLLAACQHEMPQYPPPLPPNGSPPLPPAAQDAGGPTSLEPTRINPQYRPQIPMGGAPVMVSPRPPLSSIRPSPAPMPAPAPARSSAPASAAAAQPTALHEPTPTDTPPVETAGLEPGMYIVHRHAPGTPCRPVSHTEIEQLAASVRPTP